MSRAPHSFTLRQLQYAVAVADCLSFSRAADECHVSQPSLSAQIAELEQALGIQLFERNRRHVLLAPAARDLIERARLLLRDASDVQEQAQRSSDPLAGNLHIGVIPTIGPYLLPHLAPALSAAFPRLTLLWVEDKTEALLKSLKDGSLDGALLALEADIGDVECEIIGRDAFVLATAPGHPLAHGRTPLKPADLCDESVLLLDDGHCFREQALSFCSDAKAQELEFRATSLQTLSQMVAAGTGVTLLPELAVPMEAAHARLHIRPFSAPSPGRTLALIWRKGSTVAAALKQVAQIARETYPAIMRPKAKPAPPPSPTFAELLQAQPHRAAPFVGSSDAKVGRSPARQKALSLQINLDEKPLLVSQEDEQFQATVVGTSAKSLSDLKRGRHGPQLTLDAHGLTVAEATRALDSTLQTALNAGLRTVLVIHGRGHNSGSKGPVLKNAVLEHLTRLRSSVILALCSAPAKWGGTGATLVRLRQHRRD